MVQKVTDFDPSILEVAERPEGESGLEKMAPLLREARATGNQLLRLANSFCRRLWERVKMQHY